MTYQRLCPLLLSSLQGCLVFFGIEIQRNNHEKEHVHNVCKRDGGNESMVVVWESGIISLSANQSGIYGFSTTNSKPHHIIIKPVNTFGPGHLKVEYERNGRGPGPIGPNFEYFKFVSHPSPIQPQGFSAASFRVVAIR